MKLKDVSLKFGEKVILDSFSYDFNKGNFIFVNFHKRSPHLELTVFCLFVGDKIGIVGGNGVGR